MEGVRVIVLVHLALPVASQVHEAKYVFPIPDGLKELSSDIIREVLRHQPEHINGFIANYLEAMLMVREQTRDTSAVICDVFEEGRFFDELYKSKSITRPQANAYATTIQAAWRGYVVRRKLVEWLKKKKRIEYEKERKKILKIEELLEGMGITYEEATRAAGVIQSAYQESKRGKWISSDFGEIWIGETIPFGQRIREGDRAQGRYDKWEKKDFGDFFEMDKVGAIKYVWPRVGQLRKIRRDEIPDDVEIVEFFAMRDLNGQEQYSYLLKSQSKQEKRGIPIGFLIPVPRALALETTPEIVFVKPENVVRMGNYTYVFKETVDREEIEKFDDLLKANEKVSVDRELLGEFDYDPNWVLPRVLVRIKKEQLLPTDDEVKFKCLPSVVVCEEKNYTFRAESLEQTAKIIRFILRENCPSVEESFLKAANLSPYKIKETGRIIPVPSFSQPDFVQKIEIIPESSTEEDTKDLVVYDYIFVPVSYAAQKKKFPKGEPVMKIFITRFQGYHSDYKGSLGLENKVFIMGPKLASLNGKPLTYESFFWDEFGEEAWYKLLYDSQGQGVDEENEVEGGAEVVEEEEEEEEEEEDGDDDVYGEPQEEEDSEKEYDEVLEVKEEDKQSAPTVTSATYMEGGSDAGKVGLPAEASLEGEGAKDTKEEEAEPEKADEEKPKEVDPKEDIDD